MRPDNDEFMQAIRSFVIGTQAVFYPCEAWVEYPSYGECCAEKKQSERATQDPFGPTLVGAWCRSMDGPGRVCGGGD